MALPNEGGEVSAISYDVFRPLADELAASQNELARAVALGPTFKTYAPKMAKAQLRQAAAIIAICELVKLCPAPNEAGN
jgi:hypothetical protein